MRIAITRHLDDDHFDILAASATHMATTDVYCEPERFADFGQQLLEFPRGLEDEAVFEAGSRDPKSAFLAELRAFVYDSAGHVALEILMRNRATPPHGAESHFFIPTEAVTLNHLGAVLIRWARSSIDEHFVYDDDAEPIECRAETSSGCRDRGEAP